MNPKHQADTCVFPSDVRLAVLLFDVGVSQLQDSYAVNPGGCKATVETKSGVGSVKRLSFIKMVQANMGGFSGAVVFRSPCTTHTTLMLFFGSRGISSTFVTPTISSMLGVVTVFPVMRWTW